MKISELLQSIGYIAFEGDDQAEVSKIASIDSTLAAQDGHENICWISDKNAEAYANTPLTCGLLIISPATQLKLKQVKANFLMVANPRLVFAEIIGNFFAEKINPGIEKSASIDESAQIGKDCYIGRNVVIEAGVTIGDYCVIQHNTCILKHTQIGDHVVIGCNNTIGNYGFGYEKNDEQLYRKIEHIGKVVIKDNVEIHNNTCIDRGVLGDTIIGNNSKIDNLVHIAHGVQIGNNCLIIANAMIAGSVKIGDNTWVAPSASVKNKIEVGSDNMIGLGAVVLKNTSPGATYIGNPAETMDEYKKWSAAKKILLDKK